MNAEDRLGLVKSAYISLSPTVSPPDALEELCKAMGAEGTLLLHAEISSKVHYSAVFM